ncbi:MAG: hypothetical protein LRY73_04435 [Bacillus sp. (in: Bacteria)]|nr:hypothetical protein [Bacillus sp. (in: firmicutes)]
MKKLIVLLMAILLGIVLVACGNESKGKGTPDTDGTDVTAEGETEVGTEETGNTGVMDEEIIARLTEVAPDQPGEITFLYEVINNSGDYLDIPFDEENGGGFSHIVRNGEGEEVSQPYLGEGIKSIQRLSPNESIHTKIILFGYEDGTYELEVWLESELGNTYNQTIMFTVE